MMGVDQKLGVLLMAYGGPNSLDEVEPYLVDVRGGRWTPNKLVEEIRERYRAIGGRSPLLEITSRQATALSDELTTRGMLAMVVVGMRHWRPYVAEAVQRLVEAGVERLVAICMAPHYSSLSIGLYHQELDRALAETAPDLPISKVASWHAHPGLIEGFGHNIRAGLRRFTGMVQPFVIFTAHSLPRRIVKMGDPYPSQLQATVALIAARIGLDVDRYGFAYQSAGRSPEPWLQPSLEKLISDLAASGQRRLLIAPIGFVTDNLEVLYDVDIEARRLAEKLGGKLERIEMLNDSPAMVSVLSDLVLTNLPSGLRYSVEAAGE